MANKALLIGNGTFAETSGLRSLQGTQSDLDAMCAALTHTTFGLFEPGDVKVCPELPKADLELAIENFLQNTSRGDYVLIYYTGHGIMHGEKLHLAAQDTVETLATSAVSSGIIKDLLDSGNKAERIAFVLDCCYAGAFTKRGGSGLDTIAEQFPGRWFLCSSTATQTSKDGATGSPFTVALTKAMLDPNVAANEHGEVTLDVVFREIAATVEPKPVLSQYAQGVAPVAKRPVMEAITAQALFRELTELTEETIITAHVRSQHTDTVLLGHLTALLDLAERAGSAAGEGGTTDTIDEAWSYVSKLLRRHSLSDDVVATIADKASPVSLSRLTFEFDDEDVARLPWEYLALETPIVGLPAGPLAFRRNLVIERRLTPDKILRAPSDDPITKVALVGTHPHTGAEAMDAAMREDLQAIGVTLLPEGAGQSFDWRTISVDLPRTPVLVIAGSLRRIAGAAGARVEVLMKDHQMIDASKLVEALRYAVRDEQAPYRAIVIESWSTEPAKDALTATNQLAIDIARSGIGNVVFLCHPPAFINYLPDRPGGRTFVGLLVGALNAGASIQQALYAARSRLESRYVERCERVFGVPGLYVPEYRSTEKTSESSGPSRRTGPSSSAPTSEITEASERSDLPESRESPRPPGTVDAVFDKPTDRAATDDFDPHTKRALDQPPRSDDSAEGRRQDDGDDGKRPVAPWDVRDENQRRGDPGP